MMRDLPQLFCLAMHAMMLKGWRPELIPCECGNHAEFALVPPSVTPERFAEEMKHHAVPDGRPRV